MFKLRKTDLYRAPVQSERSRYTSQGREFVSSNFTVCTGEL